MRRTRPTNPNADARHAPSVRNTRGFSMIELVIVVVIIGVISAIAIPRLSRGADGATTSALKHDLIVLNKALDVYAAEHGGNFPDSANVEQQLLQYTDAQGNVSATPTTTHIYGPYLRKVPAAPAGEAPGSTKLSGTDAPDVGWLYNENHGRIYLNRVAAVDTNKEDTVLGRLRGILGL
ncbi:MAG: prepilin-type N-terminal cleavage/methylation domain-containing protein [Phycisphaeraceae bacterium]